MSMELPTLDQQSGGGAHQSTSFHFVLDALYRHWLKIGIVTVIGLAIGLVIGLTDKPREFQYSAKSDLIVKQSYWHSPVLENVGPDVFGQILPRQLVDQVLMEEVAQDVALERVRADIAEGRLAAGITDDAELDVETALVMRSLQIEGFDEQGIIRITAYSDGSQESAGRLADAASRVLIQHTQLQRLGEQNELHSMVLTELEDLRARMDAAENQRWQFREAMGFRNHERLWDEMEEKKNQLLESEMAIEVLARELTLTDQMLRENDTDLPDKLDDVTDSVVSSILDSIAVLRARDVEMSVVWTEDYPERAALIDEIAEKREAALIAIGELQANPLGGSLWEERQRLYQKKMDLGAQLAAEEIRRKTTDRTLRQMIARLPELNEQSFAFEQLVTEINNLRKQYGELLEREFEIKSSIVHGTATIERRQAAVALMPTFKPGTSLMTWVLLFGLPSLLVGFGWSMASEMGDTSIKSFEDAKRYLNLEVIGMIPEMIIGKSDSGGKRKGHRRNAYLVSSEESDVDPSIVTQHDPKSPISEAYRSLRTNFQFATLQQQPKTVMVTSSVPAEGKTTTAVNFAVTMADRGMRVLVVDTDLRRPNVHRVLKMERGTGLADVLRDQIPVKDVIRQTSTENLWAISSGKVPPNPSELIGSERMQRLMGELGKSFDLVVCDAPSVHVVTDPLLLATHVESVILVVSVERARRETIMRAKALLEKANPNVAGVVLNGLKATARHYYYYYYYYDDHARNGRRKWSHTSGR